MGIIAKKIIFNRDFLIIMGFLILGLFTRAPLIEQYNSHWDGPQFAMAVVSYDILADRPSPPGYPIYIFLGKILNFLIDDPHKAILAVNIMASSLTMALFYWVGMRIFNRYVGLAAALIYFSGSVFYYFGITAYGYGVVPFATTAFAFSVYEIITGKRKKVFLAGLLFGLSFGVRPQEIVSTLPLFILGAASLRMKERINYLLSAFVFSLLWLVPVIIDIGGIKNFIDSNNSTVSAGGLTNTPETAELIRRIVQGVYLTLGPLALFLIYYPLFFLKVKKISSNQKKRIIFFAVWLLPSFLFNLLIRTDHAGHQQVYLSALVLLASFALWKITGKRKFLFYCSLVLIVIFNLWNFYTDRDPHNLTTYTQTSFHYTDIRRNDMIYSEKTAYIRSNYEPSKTLLFAMAPMWRVTMYHLPEYKLFNINALETKDERFIFIVREGKNWSKKEKTIREQLFKVPNGINKIIFFDNDYCKFLIDNLQYVRFKSNNCLGVLDVSGGDTYEYGLKKFEKK